MNSPIFVVGYMHSGTTLMKNIIDGHPDIFSCRGESRFFHSLTMLKRRYPDLSNTTYRLQFVTYLAKLANSNYRTVEHGEDQALSAFDLKQEDIDALLNNTKHLNFHAQFFKIVFDFFTEKAGKTRWLEKTPTHLFHIQKILSVIPDALFVELVRDPRDVLGSKSSRVESVDKMGQRNEIAQKVKNWRVGYDPIWDSLAWKSAIRSGDETAVLHPDKIIRIRYEDLVHTPEEEAKKIFDFLRLDFTSSLLHVSWHNTADETKWRETGISTDAIGKWQKRLNPQDVAICQGITKKEMSQLTYQVQPTPLKAKLAIPWVMLRSGFEFFERIYRRYKLGGLTYLRTVLENYFIRFKSMASSK